MKAVFFTNFRQFRAPKKAKKAVLFSVSRFCKFDFTLNLSDRKILTFPHYAILAFGHSGLCFVYKMIVRRYMRVPVKWTSFDLIRSY